MKATWMLLAVCLLPHGVGCDNENVCEDYESEYEALVAGAKACSVDADCQRLSVFSQMTKNQYEYVNQSLTGQELDELEQAWLDANCHGGTKGSGDGGDPPPEAACVEGECGPAPDPSEACDDRPDACKDVFSCEEDSDCVKVPEGCCSCNEGGIDIAINVCCVDVYAELRNCLQKRLCNQSLLCNDLMPACENGQCVLIEPDGDE